MFLSEKRDMRAAATFFTSVITVHGQPAEVTTDRSHALIRAITDLLLGALHDTTQYANNRVEADHRRDIRRARAGDLNGHHTEAGQLAPDDRSMQQSLSPQDVAAVGRSVFWTAKSESP